MRASRKVRVGDEVILARYPTWADNLPPESQAVFRFCVGKRYRVVELTEDGLLVLDVSADVDARFGGSYNDIRVEPDLVRVIED